MAAKNQGTKPRPKAQNAAKKKPAAKKRAVSKPAAPKTKTYSKTPKKSSYKKRTAKQSSGYNIHSDAFDAESYFRRRRNIKGIMLICISVIFILLFFMPGEKIWLALHQGYRGLFGYLGFAVPLINIYCAVQLMKEKSTYRFPLKVFFLCGTVVLTASTLYAFGSSGMKLEDYGTELINAFRSAAQYEGTGFIGGLFGIPMARTLGSLAGGMVLLVITLFFGYMSFEVLFMSLAEKLKEPVQEKISDHKEIRRRIREEENKIKSAEKKKKREEYVDKKVKQHMDAKKKNSNSQYKRVNRTPFYEPQRSSQRNSQRNSQRMNPKTTSLL